MILNTTFLQELYWVKNIQRILVLLEKQQAQLPLLSTKQGLTTDHPWIYIPNLHFYVQLFIFLSLYAYIYEDNRRKS